MKCNEDCFNCPYEDCMVMNDKKDLSLTKVKKASKERKPVGRPKVKTEQDKAEYKRLYYLRHREEIIAHNKAYYWKHHEERKAYNNRYRNENKDFINAKARAKRKEIKEATV